MTSLIIYYDQQCRFCKRYADYLSLHQTHALVLRNARAYPEEMKVYNTQGIDINKGMIVHHDTNIYHGADAVLYIQYLLTNNTFYQKKITKILRRPCYRCINQLRKLLLFLQGKNNIKGN